MLQKVPFTLPNMLASIIAKHLWQHAAYCYTTLNILPFELYIYIHIPQVHTNCSMQKNSFNSLDDGICRLCACMMCATAHAWSHVQRRLLHPTKDLLHVPLAISKHSLVNSTIQADTANMQWLQVLQEFLLCQMSLRPRHYEAHNLRECQTVFVGGPCHH